MAELVDALVSGTSDRRSCRFKSCLGYAVGGIVQVPATKDREAVVIPAYKRYYGSASSIQKGNDTHVEGFMTELKCNGLTVMEQNEKIIEALQSSISYAGGSELIDIRNTVLVIIK